MSYHLVETLCVCCLGQLKEPHKLSCRHHVCLTCGDRLILDRIRELDRIAHVNGPGSLQSEDNQSSIACPVCGQETLFSVTEGVESLTGDAELEAFIAEKTEQDQRLADAVQAAPPPVCDICTERIAVVDCENGCGVICDGCHKVLHGRGRFKQHRVVALSKKQTLSKFCLEHDAPRDVFCYSCDDMICGVCAGIGSSHGSHQTASAAAASAAVFDALEADFATAASFKQSVAESIDLVATATATAGETFRVSSVAINTHFDALMDLLEKRRERMLSELTVAHNVQRARLADQKLAFEDVLEGAVEAISAARNAASSLPTAEVIACRNLLRQRLRRAASNAALQAYGVAKEPLALTPVSPSGLDIVLDVDTDAAMIRRLGSSISSSSAAGNVAAAVFTYVKDFDTSGIVYFLGTDRGMSTKFTNPCDFGAAVVTASTVQHGSPAVLLEHSVTGTTPTFSSDDSVGQWVAIAFRDVEIQPTHYALRNSGVTPSHAITNWLFQASSNGMDWETLREHQDDVSVEARRFATASWPLSAKNSYSRFRIVCTGPNRHSTRGAAHYYLMLSGFEIWGTVNRRGITSADPANDIAPLDSVKSALFATSADVSARGALDALRSVGLTSTLETPLNLLDFA